MFDGVITAINDFFRDILWGITSVFLFILDFLWECVLKIATLDIGSFTFLKQWFLLISTTLTMFIIFRVVKMAIKNLIDEDYREKYDFSNVVIKLVIASVTITLMPIFYNYACSISSDAIKNINYFIPVETEEMTMSDVLIQAGRLNIEDINADLGKEITRDEEFNINMKNSNDEYMYFPTYASLFLIIIVSVLGVFIFFATALQIGQRFYMLILKYLISPYVVSGLIDPEDQSFTTWGKLVVGDLLMNFIQVYATYLILFLCTNNTILATFGEGAIALCCQIIFFLSGLSAVQNIPTTIARIIGGSNAGSMQALQDIRTIAASGKAVSLGAAGATIGTAMGAIGGAMHGKAQDGSVGSAVKEGVKSGASTLSSTFTGGRIGGGVTEGKQRMATGFNQLKHPGQSQESQGVGKGSKGDIFSTPVFGSASGVGSSPQSSSTYNAPPTEKQLAAAEKLGISGAENMNRGDLSHALEAAGMDDSWFADQHDYSGTFDDYGDSYGGSSYIPADDSAPTSEQLIMAENFGIEDADTMSRKQLDKALSKAGASFSEGFNPSIKSKNKEIISSGGSKFYQDTLARRRKK